MRLYDCALRKKVDVVIDDSIPCHRGSREPLYAQHKGNEMYILLLEKAFAKFCGSYAQARSNLPPEHNQPCDFRALRLCSWRAASRSGRCTR